MNSNTTLAILGMASFSIAAIVNRPLVAAPVAGLGLVALASALVRTEPTPARHVALSAGVAALATIALGVLVGLGPVPQSVREIAPSWVALGVVSCICVLMARRSRRLSVLALFASILAVLSVTAAESRSDWNAPGGYDVYRNHQAAGDALSNGENPYGEAVKVTSGNPFVPEGTEIVGYTYPPVVLGTYGLAAVVTDPRLVSLLAWFGVIGWFAFQAMKERQRSPLAPALLVLLATAPIWPLVWYSGWTEPLSIVLLLGTALLWRRAPVASAILLGLALASKQYFIFLLPMLLLHREEGQLKRALIAGGTAVATLLPPLLIDAPSFIQATIGNLADIGFRPDAQSLPGLLAEFGIELNLHPLLWIGIGLAFSTAVALRSRTRSDFFLGSALVLGLSFWIGSAFPNYWFLVMALTAIGVAIRGTPEMGPRGAPGQQPAPA